MMKNHQSLPNEESCERFAAIVLCILACGLLLTGCTGPSGTSSQPKPGTGIAEYRQITREAHRSVSATVESLKGLTRPNVDGSKAHPELARFDSAVRDLELTSAKTRARAEAIIARGEAYFDEWKGNLSATTNQSVVRAESQRYTRLHEHFTRVRERSREVRTEFRPFMMKLREFRAVLDTSPNTAGTESSRATIELIAASGGRVLDALSEVSKSLDVAEAQLRAPHP